MTRAKVDGRTRRGQLKAALKALRASGLLLYEETRKAIIPRACGAGDGFLVTWAVVGQPPPPPELHRRPWREIQPLGIDLAGQHVNDLATDATGSRVALALGRRTAVYETEGWRLVRELPESDWSFTVALSPDGRRLAHANREEVAVTSVDDGARLATLPPPARGMSFHPTSPRLVVVEDAKLRVVDLSEASLRPRDLFVGGRSELADAVLGVFEASLAQIDWAEVERLQCAALEHTFRTMQRQLKRRPGSNEGAVDFAAMKEQLDAQIEKARAQLAAGRSGTRPAPSGQGNERPSCAGFTTDGRYLWCGADRGLRVYDWKALATAAGDAMPVPVRSFDVPFESEHLGVAGYVYAVAEEPGGRALVFGGLSGRVYRIDLKTGTVLELLVVPDAASVLTLSFSGDGQALGICTRPQIRPRSKSADARCSWTVWSYPGLMERGEAVVEP